MVVNKIKSEVVVSPAFSFKGWNLKDWFLGNYSTIKELVKVLVPLAAAWATTHNPALVALITFAGKLILDSLEYWVKEKKV